MIEIGPNLMQAICVVASCLAIGVMLWKFLD